MLVAVAGELVALGGDRPHEVGVALGRHAEDEERRASRRARRGARRSRPSAARGRARAASQSAWPRPRWTSWCQSSKSKLSRSLAIGGTLGVVNAAIEAGRLACLAALISMRGEEACSNLVRRLAAGCDGDRVRGHRAAQARGQPVPRTRIPALFSPKRTLRRGSAFGCGARRTSGSTSSTTRGRSSATRSARESSARRSTSSPGTAATTPGGSSRTASTTFSFAEGRGQNDRVPEHAARRFNAADGRGGSRPQASSRRTATVAPTGSTSATASASRPTRSSTSTGSGSAGTSHSKKASGTDAVVRPPQEAAPASTGSRWRRKISRGTSPARRARSPSGSVTSTSSSSKLRRLAAGSCASGSPTDAKTRAAGASAERAATRSRR